MKSIFENELITIYDTGHDYDFKYCIENKNKGNDINIYLNELDDYIEIQKNNWVGLFSGDYSKMIIDSLLEGKYTYNYIYEVN